jgi:photosystem II stability/assembly factor-like uncharacterized protein
VRSIACPSAALCFAAGDGGDVTWSKDGGSTWTDRVPDDSDLYLGVACPETSSAFTCFAVGEHYHLSFVSGNPPYGGTAMRTADGAQTFAGIGPGVSEGLQSASCTQSVCVAVGARGIVVRSTDAGSTWSQVGGGTDSPLSAVSCPEIIRNPSPAGAGVLSPICQRDAVSSLRALACPASQTCFGAGDNGTIVGTTDGFQHWAIQASDSSPASPTPTRKPVSVNGIACASTTHCVAVGTYGTILGTTDGSTWSALSSGTGQTLRAVSCTVLGACAAVGDGGTVLVSADGSRWSSASSPVQVSLDGVSCSTDGVCVAVGSAGAVLTGSAVPGVEWSLRGAPTKVSLTAVDCGAPTSCTAVGAGGVAISTSDAGITWSETDSPVGNQLDAISCVSGDACVATGSLGAQVDTGDGGSHWTTRGTGTDHALLAVRCPTADSCFELGDEGAMLRTAPPPAGAHHTLTPPSTGTRAAENAAGLGGLRHLPSSRHQPDGLIRLLGDRRFIGRGIFNLTGARQTRTATLSARRGSVRTFVVGFQNAGTTPDAVRVSASCSRTPGLAVRVSAGGRAVTSRVIRRGYLLGNLAPKRTGQLLLQVLATMAAHGRESCTVTGTSVADPNKRDVVKAIVTGAPARTAGGLMPAGAFL